MKARNGYKHCSICGEEKEIDKHFKKYSGRTVRAYCNKCFDSGLHRKKNLNSIQSGVSKQLLNKIEKHRKALEKLLQQIYEAIYGDT